MTTRPDDVWELTTWVGVRREQLRRALRLTLRERPEALAASSGCVPKASSATERSSPRSDRRGRSESPIPFFG